MIGYVTGKGGGGRGKQIEKILSGMFVYACNAVRLMIGVKGSEEVLFALCLVRWYFCRVPLSSFSSCSVDFHLTTLRGQVIASPLLPSIILPTFVILLPFTILPHLG